MQTLKLGTHLILALGIFGLANARAAGTYVKLDYPASTATNELQVAVTYALWIPDGVKTLRGIIVHQHGAGTTASIEGSTAAYDLHWQALAKKWDCALWGSSYHVQNEKIDTSPGASELWFDPRNGSEKTFLKALGDFAVKAGHAEIQKVPWALWGHSGGGIWADVMTALHPHRVAAVWMRSGSSLMFLSHLEFTDHEVPAAVYGIPMMTNPGVKEKPEQPPPEPDTRTAAEKMKGPWLGNIATFKEYRAHGGLIGFAPDPLTGHECGDSRYLAIPFFDACLAMRLPDPGSQDQTLKPMDTSKAWLAPLFGDEAKPAADYKGNPAEAVWLPNEAVAKAWMEYVKTGATSDTTPPPAPFDVRVSVQGDQGTEIVWSAEADFESGIGGFIVLRDGQELAKVPEKPVGKFGRALFQSMTYHDTPSQPLPQMRYVDTSTKAGEKHTYSIVSVNSVGLKSQPSDAADGFKPLYNGKDLSGWHVKDSKYQNWVANGEILLCKKGEAGIANGNGWLTTDKEYSDFILRVEWKLPPGGNSGVAIRFPKDGEPAHEGMEIQMLDDASSDNAKRPPEELSGSLFVEVAPLHKADKPVGEWNKTEITCKGSMLTVKNNGVETLKVNLDDLKVLHGHHTQYKPVSQRPRKGFIGLQGDRGMQVEFRNIFIKEL